MREGAFTEDEIKDELQDEELKYMIQSFVQKNLEGQSTAYITKAFQTQKYIPSRNEFKLL
jgi:hypothetical protein